MKTVIRTKATDLMNLAETLKCFRLSNLQILCTGLLIS